MLNALKVAEDSLESINVSVLSASTSNPGIPPSSLMAFLRKVLTFNFIVVASMCVSFVVKPQISDNSLADLQARYE